MGVYTDADTGQTYFGEPEDKGKRLLCANCGKPIRAGQTVAYEPRRNRWTHLEPECKDTAPLGAGPRDPQWAKDELRERRKRAKEARIKGK